MNAKSSKVAPSYFSNKSIDFEEFEKEENLSENEILNQVSHDIQDFISIARALYPEESKDFTDIELSHYWKSQKGHRGKALAAIGDSIKWRQSVQIDSILAFDFSDMDAQRKLFFSGHALDGSPILWFIGQRHRPSKDPEFDIKFVIFTLEKARKSGILTDKLTFVFDRSGMKSLDIPFVRRLVPLFQKHYPEKLSKIYLFPKNSLLSMGLKLISVALQPETIERIILRQGPECLFEGLDRDNILEKYGGKLKDGYDEKEMERRANDESFLSIIDNDEKEIQQEQNELIEPIWEAPQEVLQDD